MELFDSMKVWTWVTANGAVTNTSSLNKCIDLFFIAWASRNMDAKSIQKMFSDSFYQDRTRTLKILFWARDCRGGAWERRFFSLWWDWLRVNHKEDYDNLIKYVPEYGRWSDIFWPEDSVVFEEIKRWLSENNSLLAKWLPRKWDYAKAIQKYLWLTPRQYRKTIVGLTSVVETQMCNKEWSAIKYSSVPSIAFNKYRKAFERNDESRFNEFIGAVNDWEETLNASVLYPYSVYQNFRSKDKRPLVEAQWKSLADYSWNDNILPVIDTSWSMESMYGKWKVRPIDISISLWVYLSEKIQGKFHNKLISFEGKPRLHEFSDSQSVCDKFSYIEWMGSDCNTNLQAVFDLILSSAVKNQVPQSEMPKKIVIISDMEFDSAQWYWRWKTNYESIRELYRNAWYELPYIIFWNVNGREWNVPALQSDYVGLVSWASASVIKSIMMWDLKTPQQLMDATIMSERYEVIN